ncbi:4Fe-4S dicluster domain-containing protein [Candidatus Magnetominusculus dajiuhuensis]|uniref:4Fe-4S dicluster domain-containing protein n=1 Tax=Candidatus Magnetominusculus dajiuhuensis TaxID=3137712 RepID=UPI003B42BEE9
MAYVVLKKDRFDDFVSALSAQRKVMAPVSKGYNQFEFDEVHSGREVTLSYIPTILPPKKYFMPQRETLIQFNSDSAEAVVDFYDMVILGVHTCDLAGIQCLNMVFSERPKDYNYLVRKNNITIIGLECNDYCDKYASCTLMSAELPNGGYDLFITEFDEYMLFHVSTQTGENIINSAGIFEPANASHMSRLAEYRRQKRSIFNKELPVDSKDIAALFDKSFNSRVWDELNERCLACGNCTNVCPTCYCFDVIDEPALDLTTGRRYRRWDSCQLEPFARVAGGANFRESRGHRQRHRYYRKFSYPVRKFFRYFCTGCGRCSRTCMANIVLKDVLRDLLREHQ